MRCHKNIDSFIRGQFANIVEFPLLIVSINTRRMLTDVTSISGVLSESDGIRCLHIDETTVTFNEDNLQVSYIGHVHSGGAL